MNLASFLKFQCITQAQFAKQLGKTQSAVSRMCSDSAPRISLETAIAVEALTGGAVEVEGWPQFAALKKRHPNHPEQTTSHNTEANQ